MTLRNAIFGAILAVVFGCSFAVAAEADEPAPQQPGVLASAQSPDADTASQHKRLFGIIPNYRTDVLPVPYRPLTTGTKFKLATKDAFDRGTVILAGLFAGLGQLQNSQPEFGQGAAGYGRYFGTSYCDFVTGNFMTEAVFPTLLHQDPRFFPLQSGTFSQRLGAAVKQIFWTHNDNGTQGPNYSELLGNATAVGISNSYYPSSRTLGDNLSKWGSQIGVDMAANVVKAFSGDIYRKFHKR